MGTAPAPAASAVDKSLGTFHVVLVQDTVPCAIRICSSTFSIHPLLTHDQSKFPDDMIKERRKATTVVKKDVSNKDRAIGTSRAKRDAAMKARRGITTSSKPTQMQVEVAVQKQSQKTKLKEAKKTLAKKTNTGQQTPAQRSANRKKKQEATKIVKLAAKQQNKKEPTLAKPPSKKAVKGRFPLIFCPIRPALLSFSTCHSTFFSTAAVNAMAEKGFTVPQGMKMVISFQASNDASPKKTNKNTNTPATNNNNRKKKNNNQQRGKK